MAEIPTFESDNFETIFASLSEDEKIVACMISVERGDFPTTFFSGYQDFVPQSDIATIVNNLEAKDIVMQVREGWHKVSEKYKSKLEQKLKDMG